MPEITRFRYQTPLEMYRKILGGGELFYLSEPYRISFFLDGEPQSVTVPKDFGFSPSVPKYLRSLVSTLGPWFEGACPHDFMYQTGLYTREIADLVYWAAMEAANVDWWNKRKIYWGIRAGGWASWQGHRKKD